MTLMLKAGIARACAHRLWRPVITALALGLVLPPPARAVDLGRVTQASVACREEGKPGSPIVRRLSRGTRGVVVDRYPGWVNLDLGEEACWAPAQAVDDADAPVRPQRKVWAAASARAPHPKAKVAKVKLAKTRHVAKPPRAAPRRALPAGASAICADGTPSFSRSRRGTCSHHGGVARWL